MNASGAPLDLCLEVLGRLHKVGVLREIVLVGSWCTYFYRTNMVSTGDIGTLRTDDMDFAIPVPLRTRMQINLPEIVRDLGFIVKRGMKGQMALEHADMRIDFLVPERGKGSDQPYHVRALGVMAQRLRFMGFLLEDTVLLKLGSIALRVPNPARFGLHKLIVSERRTKPDKAMRDREQAVDVLRAVFARGEGRSVRDLFDSLPKGWKKDILNALKKAEADDLGALLTAKPA